MRILPLLLLIIFLVGCTNISANLEFINPQKNYPIISQINSGISMSDDFVKKYVPDGKVQEISQGKIILDVPIIEQKPELRNGCEVTSLAMLLQYAGINIDKMELANQVTKDSTPLSKSEFGNITNWGNPNKGFVGDITGKSAGYAAYAKPIENLMMKYLPKGTINLTGKDFDEILKQIKIKKPVIVWTTANFAVPSRWISWNDGVENIQTTLDLHVVVLVGYDSDNVYINDPLTGNKSYKINKNTFIESWEALGKQALSYK